MRALNPISKLCIFHAAAPLVTLLLFQLARWFVRMTPSRGLLSIYDAFLRCVAVLPLWFVIFPFANRGQRGQVILPLTVGTVLWIFPALATAGVLLVMYGQRH